MFSAIELLLAFKCGAAIMNIDKVCHLFMVVFFMFVQVSQITHSSLCLGQNNTKVDINVQKKN